MSEKTLWAAVVVQAKEDIHKKLRGRPSSEAVKAVDGYRDDVRKWLHSEDFDATCEILDIDTAYMRNAIETVS